METCVSASEDLRRRSPGRRCATPLTRTGTPSPRWRIARATSRAEASRRARASAIDGGDVRNVRRRSTDAPADTRTDAIDDQRRYGALSKREKVDYILDQVRLMLAKGDRVRAYILSKKVQRKTLEEDDLQDLKSAVLQADVRVPRARGRPARSGPKFLGHFQHEDGPGRRGVVARVVVDGAVPGAQSTCAGVSCQMQRALADNVAAPKLEKLPTAKHLLTLFTTQEIVGVSTHGGAPTSRRGRTRATYRGSRNPSAVEEHTEGASHPAQHQSCKWLLSATQHGAAGELTRS